MANPMMGEAPLGDLTLCFQFGTFIELEQKTGMKMSALMQTLQDGLGFGDLRDFTWAGLRAHHPMPDDEVVALLNETGFEVAAAAIGKAVSGFFDQQRAKAKNPPKAK